VELNWWYFAIKLAAYAGWMVPGLKWFSSVKRPVAVRAVVLGALRLMMGLGFGLIIWVVGSLVYAGVGELTGDREVLANAATYLAVYVPVRWIEWAIFDLVLSPESRSPKGFLAGVSGKHRAWRLGGIAVSCLADIPVVISLGGFLPVGRFMC